MTDRQDWEREIVDRVASQVTRYRNELGLKNDDLRKRLEGLGWKLTKDGLASILAGSRKRASVSVGDVLLLAQALDVYPVALIAHSDGPGIRKTAPDGDELPPVNFEQWLTGEYALSGSNSEHYYGPTRFKIAQVRILRSIESAFFGLDPAKLESDDEWRAEYVQNAMRTAQLHLEAVERQYPNANIGNIGVNPETLRNLSFPSESEPPLPVAFWVELFEREGWDVSDA